MPFQKGNSGSAAWPNYQCDHCGQRVRGGINALARHQRYDCEPARLAAIARRKAEREQLAGYDESTNPSNGWRDPR